MKNNSEKLLEIYIKEIMDPHSFAPARELEVLPNISKQEFNRKANSLDKLFKDLKININLPAGFPEEGAENDLNEFFSKAKEYYGKFKDFLTIGNKDKYGIDNAWHDGFEKFMVVIFPELMDAIMTAHVQAYVTEWKKGFYGADKFNLKKLVFTLPKRRKSQSEAFNSGYNYRIKAYKEKKSNANANVYTSWTKAAESFAVEEALKDYDEKASAYGGFKIFFSELITKDINPVEYIKSFQFYIKQFGATRTVLLFIIQSSILALSYHFLVSQKFISAIKASGIFGSLATSTFGPLLIKNIIKLIKAKVLSIFSQDEIKKQMVELELFDRDIDPNIDLDKLYLERYRKENPGVVTIGGKIRKNMQSSSSQNFGNQEDIDDLDFLSNISFDSESGLKASQNEVKALRKLIRLMIS